MSLVRLTLMRQKSTPGYGKESMIMVRCLCSGVHYHALPLPCVLVCIACIHSNRFWVIQTVMSGTGDVTHGGYCTQTRYLIHNSYIGAKVMLMAQSGVDGYKYQANIISIQASWRYVRFVPIHMMDLHSCRRLTSISPCAKPLQYKIHRSLWPCVPSYSVHQQCK